MRTSGILGAALFVLLLFGSAQPSAAGPAERCRRVIDRVGNALVEEVSELEGKCLARRALGALPATTQCLGAGTATDAITDDETRAQLDRLFRKSERVMEHGCDDFTLLLSPPQGLGFAGARCAAINGQCGGQIESGPDARACVRCTHVSAAHYLMSTRYPGEAPPAACDEFRVVVSVLVRPGVSIAGAQIWLGYPETAVSLPGSGNTDTVLRQVKVLPGGGLQVVNDRDTDGNLVDDQLVVAYVTTPDNAFPPGPFVRVAFCLVGPPPPLESFTCLADASDGSSSLPEAACTVALAP